MLSVAACSVQGNTLRRWEEWMGAVQGAVERSDGRKL